MSNRWNHERFLVVLSLFAVTLGAVNMWKTLRVASIVKEDPAPNALYLPSPIEVDWLSHNTEVWPGLFRAEHPPTPERMPELYTFIERSGRFGNLEHEQVEQARAISATANSLALGRLEALLPKLPDPTQILAQKSRQSCALWEQETLYRWVQVRPKLRADYWRYLKACDPDGVMKDWVALDLALERKDRSELEAATERLRQRSYKPDKSWSMWFASEAAKVGQIALQTLK